MATGYDLASSGEMRTGWIQDANGKLYFQVHRCNADRV